MAQENCTERIRPTRRELRIARQAAEQSAERAAERQERAVGRHKHLQQKPAQCAEPLEAVAEQNSPDLSETVVLNLDLQGVPSVNALNVQEKSSPSPARVQISPFAKHLAFMKTLLHSSVGSRHAAVSVGVGFAVTALAIGTVAFNQSAQAQAVAGASVLLNMVDTSADETPESMTASEDERFVSQAQKRAAAANDIAHSASAVCWGLANGASSVASVYMPNDFSMVYMPMKEGEYSVTSPFGPRISPITGAPEIHTGVDMAGDAGTPIYAVADGVVLSITWGGAGNNGIVIEHHVNGQVFTSRYLHSYADQIMVKPGDEVKAGQQIASVGSSGMSTGPHLHFEMHHGAGIDTDASEPLGFLEDLGALDLSQKCVG